MYDTLLDDLEDHATTHPEDTERIESDEKSEESIESDELESDEEEVDDNGSVTDVDSDTEVDLTVHDPLLTKELESWSDDPVRMYLTQMGEIPLLTRPEEIALAKRIEVTRARFRRKVLECDYVMQSAFRVLRRVYEGDLPFDRTVQVSVTDRLEKEQILGRLPHNLKTLAVLLKRNGRDYQVATSRSRPVAERRMAWRRLSYRRRRAVRLVEELGLRTQRIEPMIRNLEEFSRRIDELKARIDEHRKNRKPAGQREPWLMELRSILRATQETPTSLRNRIRYLKSVYTRYQKAKR